MLVLEAAYEATLWAAVSNAQRGVSNVVFLTFLGVRCFWQSYQLDSRRHAAGT